MRFFFLRGGGGVVCLGKKRKTREKVADGRWRAEQEGAEERGGGVI